MDQRQAPEDHAGVQEKRKDKGQAQDTPESH
jgi:hypothetical protein